ncbi:alpha/beta hydrolase [Rhodopseudomonas sp. BR0M22]|uniref:alpha/beta fold hydrolase n=1 Tax=Rhodopseudomonas sp. BR0M22 TaxID=2269369 RepID=UPI0013E015E2|nr:alpha/beta hydrolase [Rhodopseudomonas sp. BR0M22]NEW91631.1 alpha/beta hydrolase [Rhodopseudomonas sp. BR0M22]
MATLTSLFAPGIIALLLTATSALADPIAPAGKAIGQDGGGHTIYQVDANGISIGYKLIGQGAPMVMIMGLGGTAEHWPPQVVEALAKTHQLILMDNRGMGHSTANDTTFSYPLFAADVIGLLDALKVERSDVLGYSMGSTITQELLLEYPTRFNKALIHATSTDGSNVAKALHGRVPADPIVARQVEATTHWKTPLDKLPSIPNQVMLVVGTADDVVGTESSKTLASAIPGAWLVQFKGATHHLMYETPEGFSAAALTFFETNETVTPKVEPNASVAPPPARP